MPESASSHCEWVPSIRSRLKAKAMSIHIKSIAELEPTRYRVLTAVPLQSLPFPTEQDPIQQSLILHKASLAFQPELSSVEIDAESAVMPPLIRTIHHQFHQIHACTPSVLPTRISLSLSVRETTSDDQPVERGPRYCKQYAKSVQHQSR